MGGKGQSQHVLVTASRADAPRVPWMNSQKLGLLRKLDGTTTSCRKLYGANLQCPVGWCRGLAILGALLTAWTKHTIMCFEAAGLASLFMRTFVNLEDSRGVSIDLSFDFF